MKGRILLVDDNREFLDSLRDILEDEGYAVETAGDGGEALRLSDSIEFDVIILDIVMPGMNGVETLIEIKRRHPGVEVVMVTAYAVTGQMHQALQEGAYAVLEKPLNMVKLLELIEEILKRRTGGLLLVADNDMQIGQSLRKS